MIRRGGVALEYCVLFARGVHDLYRHYNIGFQQEVVVSEVQQPGLQVVHSRVSTELPPHPNPRAYHAFILACIEYIAEQEQGAQKQHEE